MANSVAPAPPALRQADTDLYHGVPVPDPYRWLEDGHSPATQQWVAQQNERTRQALDARPDRGQWHERLVALMGLPVVLQAKVRGDRLFVVERAPAAEQYALVLRSVSHGDVEPHTLVDPAGAAADAANAIDWFEPSPDGRLVAYGVSEGGTESSTLAVLDVDTGDHRGDSIDDMRAASVAWLPDSSGFYYTSYPPDDQYNRRVSFHALGSAAADDTVVWSDPAAPQSWPDIHISADGRYLGVEVLVGWGHVDAFLLDRESGVWTTIVSGVEAVSSFDFAGDNVIISTTIDAPRGRIVVAPRAAPGPEQWATIVPERDGVLGMALACRDDLLVVVNDRGVDHVERWSHDGEFRGACGDFGLVSVMGMATDPAGGDAAFVTVAGFDSPAALYRVDVDSPAVRCAPSAGQAASPPPLAVSALRYPSLDGTAVGLFVIHRADVQPNEQTPAILNGYGGFAITETPQWSPTIAAWCAAGGLYAIAGLRGGLEEGQAWHNAGRRAFKQNVFDDFHAAADWLVASGMTSRDKLAIAGGSNGGLLVGAALTQRPDLCRAVWCAVPLLDMVRYPQFLIAKLWTDEYGDPDVEEEFAWVHAYSPYHRVREGVEYPAVLLTTAEGDTRVDPLHARKMAAALQWASAAQADHPVLLYQEARAGHGVGKPVSKRADEFADVLTFLSWQLAVQP